MSGNRAVYEALKWGGVMLPQLFNCFGA